MKIETIPHDLSRMSQLQRWWHVLTKRQQFVLLEDYTVDGQTIPAGFITDGMSVPWPLSVLLHPRAIGFEESVIHDYEHRYHQRILLNGKTIAITRKQSNKRMKQLIDRHGIKGYGKMIYVALRAGSWLGWN